MGYLDLPDALAFIVRIEYSSQRCDARL